MSLLSFTNTENTKQPTRNHRADGQSLHRRLLVDLVLLHHVIPDPYPPLKTHTSGPCRNCGSCSAPTLRPLPPPPCCSAQRDVVATHAAPVQRHRLLHLQLCVELDEHEVARGGTDVRDVTAALQLLHQRTHIFGIVPKYADLWVVF